MPYKYHVEMDFYADWIRILKTRLKEAGYRVDNQMQEKDIPLKYLNLLKRMISPTSRTALVSKEFTCPAEHKKGLENVLARIRSGENLTPHLSKRITDLDYDDALLNDWGIHHLHLGLDIDASGFASRTGPLLFAHFDNENAYLINVMNHGDWSKQKIIKIIHDNWPDHFSQHRLQGVLGLESQLSDEDIGKLRKAGISTLVEPEPGNVYAPIGGGYAAAGNSIEALMTSDRYANWITELENHVRMNIHHFVTRAKIEHGISLASPIRLIMGIEDNNEVFVMEPCSRVIFRLGSLP